MIGKERAFLPRAILMGAGLVQLPPMLALLGGVQCKKKLFVSGQFFGVVGSAVSITPQLFGTDLPSLFLLSLFVLVPASAGG